VRQPGGGVGGHWVVFFREENHRVQINARRPGRTVTLRTFSAEVPDLSCQPQTFAEALLGLAGRTRRSTSSVSPVVITKYFSGAVAGRWKRATVSFHVQSLRSFFRYASSRGWCVAGIAESIDAPRLYIRKSAAGPVVGRREEASCQRQRCVGKSDQKSLCDPALRGLRSSRWRSLSPAC
jgi:hypothetical protein